MDNRPIGFFDSGLGGLTCIPWLLGAFPGERIVYFGDTARTPYGSKAPSTIRKFAAEITDFLIDAQGVKMVVIACNTVSATALDGLRARRPGTPILGIIGPAALTVARTCTNENRICVIGTKATIESEAYPKSILGFSPGLSVFGRACPAFVPLIEEGIIRSHVMDLTIEYYLDPFLREYRIDTLVLGCTHYPLIRNNLERLYPDIRIIDPSREILQAVADALGRGGLQADAGAAPDGPAAPGAGHLFYASDLSENFVNMIDTIFSGTGYPVTFSSFDLEKYLEHRG